MKQLLIFGLLMLIQVNNIYGYWIQQDVNDNLGDYSDETQEESGENNDYTQNFQDSLQSWNPSPYVPETLDEDSDEYQIPNVPMTSDEDSDEYQVPYVPMKLDEDSDEYQVPYGPVTLDEDSDELQVPYVPNALDEDGGDYQFEDVNDESFQQVANIRRRRSSRSIPYFPEAALQRTKRDSNWIISECTRDECRRRGNGYRGLEECGPAFCTCQNGHAYLQGCGQGLVYYAEKRLCTWYYEVPGC